MQILEWSKISKIEDRAKVNVETFCSLSCENSPATRKFGNSLSSKCLIIGVERGPMLHGGQGNYSQGHVYHSQSTLVTE